MNYLPLIILLTFVSILSILLDRRRTYKAAVPEQTKVPAAAAPVGGMARLTQQWTQRFGRKPTAAPEDPLRVWLAAVFVENPAERLWFANLTPEQFKLLGSELAAFCAKLDFDLTWLVEQAAFKPAILEATGKTIVTHYCRAVRAAVLVHDELQAVQRYQAFLANPASKENLAFGQQLFARLVYEKATPPATPELVMAEEKERQTFVMQAIQTAAQQNNAVFSAALKAVVSGVAQPHLAPADTTLSAMRNSAMQNNVSATSHIAA